RSRNVAGERTGSIERRDVVVAAHDLTEIGSRIAREANRARRINQAGRNNQLVIRSRSMLIEHVVAVAFDDQLEILSILADPNFVANREIRLQVSRRTVVVDDSGLHDVSSCRIAAELREVAAALGPLASGRGANDREARTDRRSLINCL